LKHLVKEALRGTLPDEILDRQKRGFGAPMSAWLRGEVLMQKASRPNRSRLAASFTGIRWNLQLWCRLYLDGQSLDEPTDELLQDAA
jgi:hypothetical protein